MLPPIDDDIINQHLNIVLCNCYECYNEHKLCNSRIRTILRALNEQIETIEDSDIVEWKKEILKKIEKKYLKN